MIYKRKLSILVLTLACIFFQLTNAQLQLSDPDEQFLLTSAQPGFVLKSVQLPNGIQLEYAEQGTSSGTPVIFLHGYTDSWRSFEHVLPLLPGSIHAFALSQRGHGNSDRSALNYKPEDFASDLAAFMKQLKIESAIIVGHSMGSTIAQCFASNYPQLTKALVLAGSFATYSNNFNVQELKQAVFKMTDSVDFNFAYEFQKASFFNPVASQVVESYATESMKVPARVWKAIARQLMEGDYLKELKRVDIPTMIIWGDKDVFCPRADQEALLSTIEGSVLFIYEGLGHAIHWEDPKRFAKDIVEFIGKTEESSLTIGEINLLEHLPIGSFY